jgi:hypothetical protein
MKLHIRHLQIQFVNVKENIKVPGNGEGAVCIGSGLTCAIGDDVVSVCFRGDDLVAILVTGTGESGVCEVSILVGCCCCCCCCVGLRAAFAEALTGLAA